MMYYNIILLFLSFLFGVYCDSFYYFAYGSNLAGKRLKINSPSAEFLDVAVLPKHRLDFNLRSELWNGSAATIVKDPEATVTGVLWTLDIKDLPHLDKQEGLHLGMYFAKEVNVTTLNGQKFLARTYVQTVNPLKRGSCEDLPFERRPSNTYLMVIILGAVESGLPSDYIGYLVSFPTNGYHATDMIRKTLGYPFGPK